MLSEELLGDIEKFCRAHLMAESTFGRRAVNDGKFLARLKAGGSINVDTVDRVRKFMQQVEKQRDGEGNKPEHFRFYDNRQKYLMFVNTCSEKWVVADRIAQELDGLAPKPPALRVFDAGVGDGTVLARVMRGMHYKYEKYPFYILGKEISLEDVRLALEKMPDRFYEHPATMLVLTNLAYREAPWLAPSDPAQLPKAVWHEVALKGSTTAEFEQQITELQSFLSENWRAGVSPKTGNPTYHRPVVLIIYRADCNFLMEPIKPRRGAVVADFDLVIASQPYRARASTDFKARKVIAPLTRALRPGGKLIGIHSHGGDPALEIVQKVWGDENPFHTDRRGLLEAIKAELGKEASRFKLTPNSDSKMVFRYDMHTLPGEVDGPSGAIGTSTLLAAWNAAVYVAQIEEERLADVMADDRYINATREVLKKYNGLWFFDESYVIARKTEEA